MHIKQTQPQSSNSKRYLKKQLVLFISAATAMASAYAATAAEVSPVLSLTIAQIDIAVEQKIPRANTQ
ncbi:hypothetical protein swp_0651 [Shewanella piezotolerans WP3]|uniref:TonB-dependent receptor n=1 Tax=Shewanella piezotolerans (strain WP3 / JCM 13877) TaxID=225849 RepID=B8CIJ3_SHEPW|nr:hypothetical protein [Shewanella piezotolerans]ACJ27469.1 hypothetical protein swp_0651 [Shewanella piezotolerans WP3]